MFDLFGYPIPVEKEKTFEEEYQEYIRSPQWKRIREYKIKQVGYRCEKCKRSKYSVKLHVHHLTYDRFKKERPSDLEVVCSECHPEEDEKRRKEVIDKRANNPLIKGFEKWMDKGNNKGWRRLNNNYLDRSWIQFLAYIERITGQEYKMKFWRSPDWR